MIKSFVKHPTLLYNWSRLASTASQYVEAPLNFINGKRVNPSDPTSEVLNIEEPATGRTLQSISGSGQGDVNAVVECAKISQEEWGGKSGTERSKYLVNAARILEQRQEEIAHLEVTDTGKPIWEARFDVQTAIDSLNYYAGLAPTLCGQHFNLPNGSFGYSRREPLGVVVGIGAWNYPIQMAGWKSAPSLACGNSVIFKPSQFTPLSAVALGEVFAEAGLPPGLYNVVQGGAETGQYLTNHADVAKVTFTGSVETGSKIMSVCAQGIKHVTLELGGKSPLIIFEDANIDNAVNGALMANFLTQGQVCSNGTRVYIHSSIFDDVVSRLVGRVKLLKHGNPHSDDTKIGAMINADHAQKVLGFIDRANKEGAEILIGGKLVQMDDPALQGGKYLSPCILKPSDEAEITCEEVFGPVMNVYSFDTEEEVIKRANNTRFGLAAGVFTKDLNRAHRCVAKIKAGSCYINNYNIYPIELPFGGYKMSGLGRECGTVTVEYFTQLKSVYVESGDVDCPL